MKKKFLALILISILIFSLCGCGQKQPQTTADPVETKEETKVKVGFIYLHDEQSTYDLNFLESAREACEKCGVEYLNKANIPESSECFETAMDLADNGCNIIFADSFGHEDYLIEAAKLLPDVQFCHATGTKAHSVNLPNYHNSFASIYEGRFLAGVAAGLKLNEMIENGEFDTEDALMGYVGAHPYAEVISGYTSFYLGAKFVCPTVRMKVQFTGSWYDETLEKEAANHLIDLGCKLISQHADSMGAPMACENAGIPNVSYNGSTLNVAPNTFIISSKINWTPYFEYIINCVKNNEAIDTDWVGTMKTNSVQLTEINSNVATKETEEYLNSIITKLENNEIHVFDVNTFTVNGQSLNSYLADVDSDANFEPDTEVIFDGYFHESEFRSAPYFDLNIDGIEIIGE